MVVGEFAVECEDMEHKRGVLTRTLEGRPLLSKSVFRCDTGHGDAAIVLLSSRQANIGGRDPPVAFFFSFLTGKV